MVCYFAGMQSYPSKSIENAVEQISKLPGIGKKSALRLALHLLKNDENYTNHLVEALAKLKADTQFCLTCHNLSDDPICSYCNSSSRDKQIICVVEDFRDVMAIENTHQYNGLYHVLGGLVSPMNGVGPSDLHIDTLLARLDGSVTEIILALSPNMEGDTTAFYLNRKLTAFNLKVSTIARGIPIGGELEYADEITLGRSIVNRVAQ